MQLNFELVTTGKSVYSTKTEKQCLFHGQHFINSSPWFLINHIKHQETFCNHFRVQLQTTVNGNKL